MKGPSWASYLHVSHSKFGFEEPIKYFDPSVGISQIIGVPDKFIKSDKTSFLVGVVWCLYGSNLSYVDKIFKDEVKGNYTKFLNKSLNWFAKRQGQTKFFVELVFTDVELSEAFTKKQQLPSRTFLK